MEDLCFWPPLEETPASQSERCRKYETPCSEQLENRSEASLGSLSGSRANGLKSTGTCRQRSERFLYVIGNGSLEAPVKIGVAANVERRLRQLQAGNPTRLRVLFSVELSPTVVRKAEGACHRLLRDSRLIGEWFALDADAAIERATEVVDERLWETMPDRDTALIVFRLPPELIERVERAAAEDARTKTGWIEKAIRDALERQEKDE